MGADIFDMALNALMILAITGLWVMWFLQGAKRKKVEAMLQEAARDLQQATRLLNTVMATLDERKQAQVRQAVAQHHTDTKEVKAEKPIKREPAPKADKPSASATQVMRLRREGLAPAAIAEQLNIPLEQVRLMLLLQTPKAS